MQSIFTVDVFSNLLPVLGNMNCKNNKTSRCSTVPEKNGLNPDTNQRRNNCLPCISQYKILSPGTRLSDCRLSLALWKDFYLEIPCYPPGLSPAKQFIFPNSKRERNATHDRWMTQAPFVFMRKNTSPNLWTWLLGWHCGCVCVCVSLSRWLSLVILPNCS